MEDFKYAKLGRLFLFFLILCLQTTLMLAICKALVDLVSAENSMGRKGELALHQYCTWDKN